MVKNTTVMKNFEDKVYNRNSGFRSRVKILDSMYAYYLSISGKPQAFKISDIESAIRYAKAINVQKVNLKNRSNSRKKQDTLYDYRGSRGYFVFRAAIYQGY